MQTSRRTPQRSSGVTSGSHTCRLSPLSALDQPAPSSTRCNLHFVYARADTSYRRVLQAAVESERRRLQRELDAVNPSSNQVTNLEAAKKAAEEAQVAAETALAAANETHAAELAAKDAELQAARASVPRATEAEVARLTTALEAMTTDRDGQRRAVRAAHEGRAAAEQRLRSLEEAQGRDGCSVSGCCDWR